MLQTRITELFGIKHPIVLAGMNQVTNPELVAAVSNAGGLGVMGISALTIEDTRATIREIRKLTSKPFGINQALTRPLAKEKIQIAIEEKVPVICYALGKPGFVKQVHEYGGKVIANIALAKHAVKAAELGIDAVILSGHEAAGHGGLVTSLVLIPKVASMVPKMPILASGGFSDGRGLAAALSLGADGVWMGTRFLMTKECRVKEPFKKLMAESTEEDTLYSSAFDGMASRALKSKASEDIYKRGNKDMANWVSSALEVKKMMNLSWPQFIATSWKMKNS